MSVEAMACPVTARTVTGIGGNLVTLVRDLSAWSSADCLRISSSDSTRSMLNDKRAPASGEGCGGFGVSMV